MKHSILKRALAIGVAGFLPTVHATDNDAFVRANNVLGLSFGSQHQDYREFIDGANVDSNIGSVKPSYRLYATAQRDLFGVSDLFFGASISYANGSNTYRGALVNWITGEQTPVTSRTPTHLFDWSLRAGKAFTLNEAASVQMIPYLDYSRHRWDRLDSGDIGDYSEHYNHTALSVGIIGQYAPTEKLVLSAEAQIGHIYDANVRVRSMEGPIYFSDGRDIYYVDGAEGPVVLGSHRSRLLGFYADYAVTSAYHVTAGYRWQRFGYGRGVNNDIVEPASKSIMRQLEVGIALTF